MIINIIYFTAVLYIISLTNTGLAYSICTTFDKGKISFGQSCSSSDKCFTEYCNQWKCDCLPNYLYDSVSGLCFKKNGNISSLDGECGYVISPDDVIASSVNTWNIVGDSGTYVTLVILDLEMTSSNCRDNYIEVLEGSTYLLERTCSLETPSFHASMSNNVIINYKGLSRGLRAIYYIRSVHAQLNETSGYIASPGYPVSYPNSTLYSWQISVRTGLVIYLNITVDTKQDVDVVRIYDTSQDTSLVNLTGSLTRKNIQSLSNHMLIQFDTGKDFAGNKGFNASYIALIRFGYPCTVTAECAFTLSCIEKLCDCKKTQYYDLISKTCKQKVNYRSTCLNSDMCMESLICKSGLCSCTENEYYFVDLCQKRVAYGHYCIEDYQCSYGFSCITSRCQCPKLKYYESGICKNSVPYNHLCNSTYQCSDGTMCLRGVCCCGTHQFYDEDKKLCASELPTYSSETVYDKTGSDVMIGVTIASLVIAAICIALTCKMCKYYCASTDRGENNVERETSSRRNAPAVSTLRPDDHRHDSTTRQGQGDPHMISDLILNSTTILNGSD